jgi:hypothetical protein
MRLINHKVKYNVPATAVNCEHARSRGVGRLSSPIPVAVGIAFARPDSFVPDRQTAMERRMKRRRTCCTASLAFLSALGCTADVKETDDSTKIEVETPKVETGEAPFHLDPRTDDDIDVDTPAPGDK